MRETNLEKQLNELADNWVVDGGFETFTGDDEAIARNNLKEEVEKIIQSQIQQREEVLKEKINHFPSIRFKGSRWVDANNLDDLIKELETKE